MKFLKTVLYFQWTTFKPGSHMSPMIGESLSVIIQGENSQRILIMSNHRQWLSPTSATYENQALTQIPAVLKYLGKKVVYY